MDSVKEFEEHFENKITDISNIPKNMKTYNGNTRKHGITINGIDYII